MHARYSTYFEDTVQRLQTYLERISTMNSDELYRM